MNEGNTEATARAPAAAKPARKRNRKSRAVIRGSSVASGSGTSLPGVGVASSEELSADARSRGADDDVSCQLVIDVVCGVNRAKLRVDGLRNGSKTPCVYMETDQDELGKELGQDEIKSRALRGSWMTPNQFQQASGRGTARDWKRSIKHHGTSLKSLISSHVLTVDPARCRCPGCNGTSTNGQRHVNVVNGDHSALNLSLIGCADPPLPSNHRDDMDEKPEVYRRRKAELMTSLCLSARDASVLHIESPTTAEVEIATDWNGSDLLYERRKRRRTESDDNDDDDNREEAEEDSDEVEKKCGLSSLLNVLAACSFTDVYRSYERRQPRRKPTVDSLAGNDVDDSQRGGCGLTAASAAPPEVDENEADSDTDRKWLSTAAVATWANGVRMAAAIDTTSAVPSGGDGALYPLAASIRGAILSEDRDATLTHIIHELRDYKKRLVEQIDASRASHLDEQAASAASSKAAAGAFPKKELPDLVRSSIPTKLRPSAQATIWNPALTTSYSLDSCGALDLTTKHSRPTAATPTTTAHRSTTPADLVLDLSCHGRHHPDAASFSPPLMTSSLRPEIDWASRSRRHSRKSSMSASSVSMATGRHDDHDNPLCWSVRDVIEFVSEVPGCQTYAETFKRFGVRGASLPVLSVDHMTGILRMRLDAARSLRAAIDRMMTSYVITATVANGCQQSTDSIRARHIETADSVIGVR